MELRYLNFANGSVHGISPMDGFAHADVSADGRWGRPSELGSAGTNLMLAEDFR
jgi:hypothetical protein